MQQHELVYWTDRAVRQYLEKLVEALDTMDEDDEHGSEGWRKRIMGES